MFPFGFLSRAYSNIVLSFARLFRNARISALLPLLILVGCQTPVLEQPSDSVKPKISTEGTSLQPSSPQTIFLAASWAELTPAWKADDLTKFWPAFLANCKVLQVRSPSWYAVCQYAATVTPNNQSIQDYFRVHFTPFSVHNIDGSEQGLITGYYEPILQGSRERTELYRYPIYALPEDLINVELSELFPQLKGLRLRGRLVGRKVVPYWSRADLENRADLTTLHPLFWVKDPVELFFLHVQGSGRIELSEGTQARVGYAEQNGHPYRSVGKLLVEQGFLTLETASMQGIKAWAIQHPEAITELLQQNPSYVFFRELPPAQFKQEGAPGAMGIPLTPERSIAVDPRFIPLGSPIFLDTTFPLAPQKPLKRLVLAQDTGGAIRGAVRADYYWGIGPEAGLNAGKMRQMGKMWLLWPQGEPLPKIDNPRP